MSDLHHSRPPKRQVALRQRFHRLARVPRRQELRTKDLCPEGLPPREAVRPEAQKVRSARRQLEKLDALLVAVEGVAARVDLAPHAQRFFCDALVFLLVFGDGCCGGFGFF